MKVIYNKEGFNAEKWGPGVWNWLHRLPEAGSNVEAIKRCLDHLCLPCPECQHHFDVFKETNLISEIGSRTDAHKWINSLHNEVNTRLGKPSVSDEKCFEDYCVKSKQAAVDSSIGKGRGC